MTGHHRRRIEIASIHNNKRPVHVDIRHDHRWPTHIFVTFPKFASLTPEDAYALADAIVDAVEEANP